MANIMLGEKVKWAFGKNPLSKAYHLEKQLLSRVHASRIFVFQLDESTDVQRTYQHFIEMCYCLSLKNLYCSKGVFLLLFCFVGGGGGVWWPLFKASVDWKSCISSCGQSLTRLVAGKGSLNLWGKEITPGYQFISAFFQGELTFSNVIFFFFLDFYKLIN